MPGPLLYRPPPRWQFWAALGGAFFIHLAAVGKHARDIPVFVVTAKDLTDAEIELLKREARALVRKNGSWKVDLLAQVRKVVGNSKLAKSAGQS